MRTLGEYLLTLGFPLGYQCILFLALGFFLKLLRFATGIIGLCALLFRNATRGFCSFTFPNGLLLLTHGDGLLLFGEVALQLGECALLLRDFLLGNGFPALLLGTLSFCQCEGLLFQCNLLALLGLRTQHQGDNQEQ